MTDDTFSDLVHRVTTTATTVRRRLRWVALLFCGIAALAAATRSPRDAVAFFGGLGVLFAVFGEAVGRRADPRRFAPVIAAIRERPDQVVLLRHYVTNDARRLFVRHWIEVKTAEHRLAFEATDDWSDVLKRLERRCPSATVIRGPAA